MSEAKKSIADTERVHEIFGAIAGDYDKMNGIISFGQHDRFRARTMRQMTLTADMEVLDLCCGTGDWTFDLAARVGQVTGLDFTQEMLDVAEKRLEGLGLSNVRLIQGDAMALPFEDTEFDLVTIGYGLRNLPDYEAALREMYRVLRPGGQLVCIEMSHPTLPVYKQLYEFYLYRIMPIFGKIFAHHYQEYRWLQKSVRNFPGGSELKQLFEMAGFADVSYIRHSGGAVASHFARKKVNK